MQTDPLFGIHAQAASLRARRAGVLAANLANADTPHYKARDLDFSRALQGAASQPISLRRTVERHLPATAPAAGTALMYRNPLQSSLDGNTVDAHVEHAAFAENALQYQTSLQFLDSRIRGVMKALQGE